MLTARFQAMAIVLSLLVLPGSWSVAQETILLPRKSTWRYLDGGQLPESAAWVMPQYDDSRWKSGRGALGYGDREIDTTIEIGRGPGGVPISYWFRSSVDLDQPGRFTYVLLRLRRDDGAIVHVNGAEVLRSNMPTGTVTPTTHSSNVVGGVEELTYFDFPLASSVFQSGRNTIAVQVHQRDATSSDLHFDLELVGVTGLNTVRLATLPRGWYGSYPSAQGAAHLHRLPLLLYFHADSQAPSRQMNSQTFTSQTIDNLLGENFIRFQLDVDRMADRSRLQPFNIQTLPVMIFVDGNGREIGRISGFHDPIGLQRQLYQADIMGRN